MPGREGHLSTLQACRLGRRAPRSGSWLLRGVDLTISPGDRLAVVGPSGAGKTVLLRALTMLDPLEEGEILWQERPVHGEHVPEFRRQVIYLHQRPALFDGSVEENLQRPYAWKAHRNARYDRERVLGLLDALGRDGNFLSKAHHDLSGGEGQIVALVRALQLDPAVLLLDEATASLDRTTVRLAEALLERWHREGNGARALVWVTHDPDQTDRVAQRILHVQAGQIARDSAP